MNTGIVDVSINSKYPPLKALACHSRVGGESETAGAGTGSCKSEAGIRRLCYECIVPYRTGADRPNTDGDKLAVGKQRSEYGMTVHKCRRLTFNISTNMEGKW